MFAEIEIANGGATRRIALRVCVFKHFQNTRYRCWGFLAESLRKPPFDHRRSNGFHAAFSNRLDTDIPTLWGSNLGGSVTENQLVQPFGLVRSQPHANHSAHG